MLATVWLSINIKRILVRQPTELFKKYVNCGTVMKDDSGAPKTGVLKNDLITLWKVTPSDARNSQ